MTINRNYYVALWLMMAGYTILHFAASVIRFYSFDYYDFDLAVYGQIVWQIPTGDMVNSVLGVNFLGHHAHFLAFPLALIYKIVPHPLTLLFIQTAVMAFGAYPVFLLAKRVLEPPLALVASACYLLYPGLIYTNAFELHYPPFAIPCLLYVCYFFHERKYFPYMLFVIATLLIQENLSLILFAFGFYALIVRSSPKWWLPVIILSAAYFLFCIKILFPALNPDVIQFISLYSDFGGSYGEIVRNIILDPIDTLDYMLTKGKCWWLLELFFPLIFIPLLAPTHLVPILPIMLQRLLSYRITETDIQYHYTSELIPFIFLAFIFGLHKLSKMQLLKSRRPVLIGSVMAAAVWGGLSSGAFTRATKPFYNGIDYGAKIKKELVEQVPPDASLVTTFQLMPHLNHRKELYSFHHIFANKYTLSQKAYDMPANVDVALIDFNDPLTIGSFYDPLGYHNIIRLIRENKLKPIVAKDNIVLFQSGATPKVELFDVEQIGSATNEDRKPLFEYNGILLESVKAQRLDRKTLKVRMTWTATRTTDHDINTYFRFMDANGQERQHLTSTVCYRIYPTQAWTPGQRISDFKYLSVGPDLWDKPITLRIGFFDQDNFATVGEDVEVQVE